MSDGTLSNNFKEVAQDAIDPFDALFARLTGDHDPLAELGTQAAMAPVMNALNDLAANRNDIQTPSADGPTPIQTIRAALEVKQAPKVELGKQFTASANPAQIGQTINATVEQTGAALKEIARAQDAPQENAPSPSGGGIGGGLMKTVGAGAAGMAADLVVPGAGTIAGLACAAFSAASHGFGTFAPDSAASAPVAEAPAPMQAPLSSEQWENAGMTLRSDTMILPDKTLAEAAKDIQRIHEHACAMRDNMARLAEEGVVISDRAADAKVRAGELDADSFQRTAENHVRVSAFGGGMQGMSGMM